MRFVALVTLSLASCLTAAAEVSLALREGCTGTISHFALDPSSGVVRPAEQAGSVELEESGTYVVRNGHLYRAAEGQAVAEATELVSQARADGYDIVIVRREYNSTSNPLRWLSAFSGHPVQVSEVRVIVLSGGKLASNVMVLTKASSYKWSAELTAFAEGRQ
jgi:hypothetical protein